MCFTTRKKGVFSGLPGTKTGWAVALVLKKRSHLFSVGQKDWFPAVLPINSSKCRG